MKIGEGGQAAAEAQSRYGADEPDVKLARRTRQAPKNVALFESRSTQRKVFRIKGFAADRSPIAREVGCHAGCPRAVLRTGRSQEDGGGLRAHKRGSGGADVRDHDARATATG